MSTNRAGFTLLELMVVVAIIGLLAAIAIPNFLSYQARSRRSEAYANLASMARAQKAVQAERNQYVDTGFPHPDPDLTPGALGTTKMTWDADSQDAFRDIGWKPEGEVFYTYAVYSGGVTCGNCDLCFTASAAGDVDGNNSVTQVAFVSPDDGGLQCIDPIWGPGPVDLGGNPIYDTVVPRNQSDY